MNLPFVDPTDVLFKFPCIKVKQPVGDLYVGALPYKILCTIADFDVRHVLQEDNDLDRYLGIQRPLNKRRVKEIQEYVNFADAAFPSTIILAIESRCADFDEKTGVMTLKNIRDPENPVLVRQIARVIDGQHRIAGLYQCKQENFECPVTLLLGSDLSDQAQMFARVNLSQTPVNPSLVYDLFELSKTRSPQKTCHEITVKLDRDKEGPFFRRIKRLGAATAGRNVEFLSQATVVRGILQHISEFPDRDRDIYLRGGIPPLPSRKESLDFIFRKSFLGKNDDLIYESVTNLFKAVEIRWPLAWSSAGQGYILARTNGYLALMRYLRDVTIYFKGPDASVEIDKHLRLLERVNLSDEDMTSETFKPGTGGETALYRRLIEAIPG